MYLTTLTLHSLLRWAVLGLGLWAVLRAYAGVSSRRAWAPVDDSVGRWFTISLDVQLLLGLVLYGLLSPITTQAFSDMGGAMRDPVMRFWAVEHIAMMVVALALAHVGRARARRAATDTSRHRTSAIFYTLALIAVLAAIPWPFMSVGRPLFRLGF
jgi:hypothetical protein